MASIMKAIIIAFLFLTRFPMPRIENISAADNGRSLGAFPLVGLVIGLLLAAIAWLGHFLLPPIALAALILVVWVFITGGLHLDGLADSADAWLGGYGNRERTLEIMKDPRCGSAAVMTVSCLLIFKFSLLVALLETHSAWWLVLPPLLGRCASVVLMMITPYARASGLGADFNSAMPRKSLWLIISGVAIMCALFLPWIFTLAVTLCVIPTFFGLRQLMISRLNGTTGDTAGALLEIIEAAVLFGLTMGFYQTLTGF
ncbi:adenosylcobinamide-GDP ribazoletransferase [Cellvibrio polysaccharolyticus]|nr:adenosylcobinamide-GDP ribazoletransferase [Cellvibrio polysaccharolyticus]